MVFKNGPIPVFFVYFRPFLNSISTIQIEKSIDGVFGIQTRGGRKEGADESTELRPYIMKLAALESEVKIIKRKCKLIT